jgi:hypothetical protein
MVLKVMIATPGVYLLLLNALVIGTMLPDQGLFDSASSAWGMGNAAPSQVIMNEFLGGYTGRGGRPQQKRCREFTIRHNEI